MRECKSFAALPEISILVEVEGVAGLKEYARVAEILGSAGGVRSVLLAEAAGTHATFTVVARGGADALQGALAANGSFERIDPSGRRHARFSLFHP